MTPKLFDNPNGEPVEIHPHYLKLYALCGIFAVLAALSVRGAMQAQSGGAIALFLLMAAFLVFTVSRIWRRAASGLPAVVVSAEGIDDHRHGFIAWTDIRRWKHSKSLLNPGFGWDLAKGVAPPRNPTIFRIFAVFNWFGGVGQRTYRKKMIVSGLEPMAAAFRQFHPEAEAK